MAARQSGMPGIFQDVLARRFFSVSGNIRFAAFETRGVQTSFWVDGPAFYLLIGDSGFQKKATRLAERFGTPVPGVRCNHQGGGVIHLKRSRGNIIAGGGGASYQDHSAGTFVTLGRNSDLLLHSLTFDLVVQGRHLTYSNQILFAAHLGDMLSQRGAAQDLETALVRSFAPHIERVPLDAAA